MSKFRIGDKVVIKGWVHDRNEHFTFVEEMDRYIGCVATVRRCRPDWYIRLDIDGGNFAWHESWLCYPKGRVDIYEC